MPFQVDKETIDKGEMNAEQRQAYLDSLFEEYHNLDYEDDIDGTKMRFKYTNVPKDDYGLTNEEILLLDDKKLNQIVSLKKYRPYREAGQQDKNQVYKTI